MRKTIGSIIILLASTSLPATAAYVKLSCENNITVNITLKEQEEIGWADLTTPNGTHRAEFFMGRGNNQEVTP